jgi:hypothetical protein
MADFSQPGSDGALPAGANEWRRGLVYTAKPGIPCPLRCGQEYRISVGFKQKVWPGTEFTGFGNLYQRVTTIANARVAQLICDRDGEPPHTWVLWHGWRCLGDNDAIATAFVTVGLLCPAEGAAKPEGEKAPTAEELMAPGGATLEMLTRVGPQRVDEMYSEFDFTDPSSANTDPVILSYGESTPACEAMNFEPFVHCAEKLVKFYYGVEPFRILRREWYRVTNTNLTVVHIHFQG